jgi:predicted phage terminase large subunit-like protein
VLDKPRSLKERFLLLQREAYIREQRALQSQNPGGLLEFIRYFWHVLEPVDPLVEGWTLDCLCAHLEAITRGETIEIAGEERPFNRFLCNVPPGFMKPVWEEETVVTKRGRIRLADVVVGDEVLTHRGRFKSVLAVHEQGELPLVHVKTFSGRSATTAPDHPFLTTRGWVAAEELEDRDYLAYIATGFETAQEGLRPEEARLLGYFVGDGCIAYAQATVTNMDDAVLLDVEHCAASLGFHTWRKVQRGCRATTIVVKAIDGKWTQSNGPDPFWGWLTRNALPRGSNSYSKRIPPSVLNGPNNILAEFLGAYWSCDGCMYREPKRRDARVSASTVNVDLARDVQHALLKLGIKARVRQHIVNLKTKKQASDKYTSYHIGLESQHDAWRFRECVPLKHSLKATAIDDLVPLEFERSVLAADELTSTETLTQTGKCRCLTVAEDQSFTAGDLVVHNSLTVNCFWPAFEWGPMGLAHLRYVAFSYNSDLPERDNDKFCRLITSRAYQELWGHCFKVIGDGKVLVTNDKTGFKRATSFGGTGTGERGHRVLLDDAHKLKGTQETDEARKSITNWVREAMQNRLNDLERDVIVAIMQRVHEEDTSGVIMRHLGREYCHLIIPMAYEANRHFSHFRGWNNGDDPRKYDGELAWPERFPQRVLDSFRENSYLWAGQYQQSPSPRGGGVFKDHWWQIHEVVKQSTGGFKFVPEIKPDFVVASLDTAFTEKEENDYSALAVIAAYIDPKTRHRRLLLVDAWKKRLELHGETIEREPGEKDAAYLRRAQPHWGLCEWVSHTCSARRVDRLLIENKARGHDVVKEIQRLYVDRDFSVRAVDPKGDKWGRANAVVDLFVDQMIYAPAEITEQGDVLFLHWAKLAIEDMTKFRPNSSDDDLVDAIVQALKHLRENGYALRREEKNVDDERRAMHRGPREPIYPV